MCRDFRVPFLSGLKYLTQYAADETLPALVQSTAMDEIAKNIVLNYQSPQVFASFVSDLCNEGHYKTLRDLTDRLSDVAPLQSKGNKTSYLNEEGSLHHATVILEASLLSYLNETTGPCDKRTQFKGLDRELVATTLVSSWRNTAENINLWPDASQMEVTALERALQYS